MIPSIVMRLLTNKYVIGLILLSLTVLYISHLKSSVEKLKKDKAQLELIVEQQKLIVENIKKDVEKVLKSKDDYIKEREKLIQEKDKLEKTLNRQNSKKKSLEELATKKTSLIQKKINRATDEVFKCFEQISNNKEC